MSNDGNVSNAQLITHEKGPQPKITIDVGASPLKLRSHTESKRVHNLLIHLSHKLQSLGFKVLLYKFYKLTNHGSQGRCNTRKDEPRSEPREEAKDEPRSQYGAIGNIKDGMRTHLSRDGIFAATKRYALECIDNHRQQLLHLRHVYVLSNTPTRDLQNGRETETPR